MKKIIALLLCCLLLAGCVETIPPRGTDPVTTDPPTEAVTDPATEAPTEPVTEAPTEEVTEPAPVNVTIYFGNENADGLETVEVQVEEVTADMLVGQLIEYGVLHDDVAINSLTVDGTVLRMDFNAAFGTLVCSMGTSGEYVVIGSTVNTFLDAFNCETAYFTVEGEILESGHNVYDFELTRSN